MYGPNARNNTSEMRPSERDSVPAWSEEWAQWTVVESAENDLRVVSRMHRLRALHLMRVRDGSSDVATGALSLGTIAGLAAKLDPAMYLTGLSALLTLGTDRYQLAIQRDNLIRAANGYACLADKLAGISTADLGGEIAAVGTDEASHTQAAEWNRVRVELPKMVSSSARSIRNALEKAMVSGVTLTPITSKQIEDIVREKPPKTPSPEKFYAPSNSSNAVTHAMTATSLSTALTNAMATYKAEQAALVTLVAGKASTERNPAIDGKAKVSSLANFDANIREKQSSILQLEQTISGMVMMSVRGTALTSMQTFNLVAKLSDMPNQLRICTTGIAE